MSDTTATRPTDGTGWWDRLAVIRAAVTTAARHGFVVAVALTWVAFWGLVVRLQVIQDEFVSAAVTGLALVLPAIVGLIAYLDPLPDPRRLVPG